MFLYALPLSWSVFWLAYIVSELAVLCAGGRVIRSRSHTRSTSHTRSNSHTRSRSRTMFKAVLKKNRDGGKGSRKETGM